MTPGELFTAPVAAWFESRFAAPTPVQVAGWPPIARGEHSLLLAPTGAGKTLAAFLWGIDRLARLPADADRGVRVLYVSPLKALGYDVERNLREPLAGIRAGDHGMRDIRVDLRTGDTPQRDRRRQLREPADILVTTPESLYLLLTSNARDTLRSVETVIVDEVHSLAPTKRGAHLALSLERLEWLCERPVQRIGLSATARPASAVAAFLGGDRPVTVVDTTERPALDLRVVVPVEDMERPPRPVDDPDADPGIWPALYGPILEAVREHTATIVFVNSRKLAERLARRLNEMAGEPLVRAHHGSVSHEQRRSIEESLKRGELRGIVATSSLELGIDMGAVDLVVLVESPGAVARGLQRAGRAGHGVGRTSKAILMPKYRGDLLEAAAVAAGMRAGAIEAIEVPANPLDVLAQQVVAACVMGEQHIAELGQRVRRAAPFRELSDGLLRSVVDMLAGGFPSTPLADLRPLLALDRRSDTLRPRRGARLAAVLDGGTIPDRGLYPVYLADDGSRVGELDEEMVFESRPGQTFVLGATTWRIRSIGPDRVLVDPASDAAADLPFWHGDTPARPVALGRAVGALLARLEVAEAREAETFLRDEHGLDALAVRNLKEFVDAQRAATGAVPTDRVVVVERFRDESGDWRICIHTPLGGRVHAPWAVAIEAALGTRTGHRVRTLWTDDGIVLRLAGGAEELALRDVLFPPPETVEGLVVDELAETPLFAAMFRENAGRALLLRRGRAGQRTPLWARRLRAQTLFGAVRQHPRFPIVLETYRTCLHDHFDVPALRRLLRDVAAGAVRVVEVETGGPSPFARSMAFALVAEHMYETDAPPAERKLAALALDRRLLGELIGESDFGGLLDADTRTGIESELQGRADGTRARDADELHDLLRRAGDLSLEELEARSAGPADRWLDELTGEDRARAVVLAGQRRWVATEDAELIERGVKGEDDEALSVLLLRWAGAHGPFGPDEPARRWGLPLERVRRLLEALANEERLLSGTFGAVNEGRGYVAPDVLGRLRRRAAERLRAEVAPVNAAALASFLLGWHGIGTAVEGAPAAVETLLGLRMPSAALKEALALRGESGAALADELAGGDLVWLGQGALPRGDGNVLICSPGDVAAYVVPGATPSPDSTAGRVLAALEERGASFLARLMEDLGDIPAAEVRAALAELVWAGLVSHDSLDALRDLRPARTSSRGRRAHPKAVPGRWYRTATLQERPEATENVRLRRVQHMLQRNGVVSREVALAEGIEGGFAAVYPILKELELHGHVQRGYFVKPLSGAQFALPAALDGLRASSEGEPSVAVLPTLDPANPYGRVVPWPALSEPEAGPVRRGSGGRVVLCGGRPGLVWETSGRMLTFAGMGPADLARCCAALAGVGRSSRGRRWFIATVDGRKARRSPLADTLQEAGFAPDYKGFLLRS